MVNIRKTFQPSSIRLLLQLATFFRFNNWTTDVTHTYLQPSILLSRDLFLSASVPEFLLNAKELSYYSVHIVSNNRDTLGSILKTGPPTGAQNGTPFLYSSF